MPASRALIRLLLLLAGIASLLLSTLDERFARAEEKVSFNRDIRPILSDNCFQCHGPDEKRRQAGLRLDLPDQARQPAESGRTAIVPGQPAMSELVRRVASTTDGERMPPADSGKQLTPRQIELFRQWIAQGAEYQGHWSFIPPQRAAPPEVKNAPWPRNSIDRFILARLERDGLSPSPEAAKATLIRRASLDLTGIPPTPQEVDAFLADTSDNAYETVVDRLLSSPRYGERMAVQWLDFARYADSNGFQIDSGRFMWPWRDWVIDAYNRNLPLDQFTIEQLAGDLLPNPTRSQLVATGFNRNHRLNGEGGLIAEEWRVETVIDRVETTGLTWLGLTLNCCRCHDHKYDPIKQREFYQLFSFFNNIQESGTLNGETRNTDPVLPVPTAEQGAEMARLEAVIKTAEAQVATESLRLPELIAAWEPGFRELLAAQNTAWTPLEPKQVKSQGGATFTRQEDGTYLVSGENPPNDTYEIAAPLPAGSFTGLLLDALPDVSLPNQSLGRYANGNFVLTRVEAEIAAPSLPEPRKARFVKAEADYSQKNWEVAHVVGGDKSKGWAIDGPTRREPRRAIFLVETPLTVPEEATLTVRLVHETLHQHSIGRFKLAATSLPLGTVSLNGVQAPENIKQILAVEGTQRNDQQKAELQKFFRDNADSPLKQADVALAAARRTLEEFRGTVASVMVMKELDQPREAFLLIRGQYDKRGDPVTAGLPAVLPPLPAGATMNRLGLARWLVDPSHPLTARVWVNRAWERFFGTGLVKTSENLGSQAEYPSHPELLDWLAVEFMQPSVLPALAGQPAQSWDMKALQKLIVMSAAYRQSSRVTPELLERDPDNRLLARGPRFRLPAELLRDQALAASGLLVEKLGGPSVRPYMPEGVWDETSVYGDLRNYQRDTGDGLHRRTLYTVWKRTAAPPTMLLFDAPSREICTVKRSRTNTPLQALSLLNEITYVEAARKLAERMLVEGGGTVEARLTLGFRLVTARPPTADEVSVLADGLAADLSFFQQDPAAAASLASFGDARPRDGLSPTDLAAYTLTANVLLNLDEAVTRE